MKIRKPRTRQPTTCRIMKDLNKQIIDIERSHNIKLTDKEKDKLKSMLCGYTCNGSCRAFYFNLSQ